MAKARTAKQRAALRKAQLASARKRKGRGSSRSKYRASKKRARTEYRAAKKEWNRNHRVKAHKKAVYTGAAIGTLALGPGLGTTLGAAGAALYHHRGGRSPLPKHPVGVYRGRKKTLRKNYRRNEKR